jgi:hypothetical protein
MLPALEHLFVDNVWLHLGRMTESITYDETLKIRHLHPYAKTADWDASYERSNSAYQYMRDEAAFGTWIKTRASQDVRTVKDVVTAHRTMLLIRDEWGFRSYGD